MERISNILCDKFWIIEKNNKRETVFQDNNQYYLVNDKNVNIYDSKDDIEKYLGTFLVNENNTKTQESYAFGYPTKCEPYESLYDVKNKRPIFKKSSNSTCYYCAGYYVLKIKNKWICCFCPKLSTVEKIQSYGPYCTEDQALRALENEKSRTT